MKRVFDIVVTLSLVLITLPIACVVVIVMLCQSPGPVFYHQQRVGQYGKLFDMWKFRSMVVGADQQGPYFTEANDHRITKIGQWLRRTSLDELPQLWNVLCGQMSLVGPRPDVPAQKINYSSAQWHKRCQVKPGITGLAQATLRNSGTAAERLQADLFYVDNLSFWQDIKILLLTMKQVLTVGSH